MDLVTVVSEVLAIHCKDMWFGLLSEIDFTLTVCVEID